MRTTEGRMIKEAFMGLRHSSVKVGMRVSLERSLMTYFGEVKEVGEYWITVLCDDGVNRTASAQELRRA